MACLPSSTVVTADMTEKERNIVQEFSHLLDKSKQLFNGLRDLPQYGHRQWQAYFGRTFDVYTRLWRFQQMHRQVLDTKYGLKRWQIGEIASKIGQLYYQYYVRTSETNYLHEAFSFYSAIRMRAYYSRATKEDRSELMVKKLRYFARFIVVCLLLKKMKLVRDLIKELSKQIEDYVHTYGPGDQMEWATVLGEVKCFTEADPVRVLDTDSNAVVISHRLGTLTYPPFEKIATGAHTQISLQEILIVGSQPEQAKFSELTVDMFRMLQVFEREPQPGGGGVTSEQMCDTSPAPAASHNRPQENGSMEVRENPHKYLLYKPAFPDLYAFMSSGFKELPASGIMLIYFSADGSIDSHTNSTQPQDPAYDFGGVATRLEQASMADSRSTSDSKEMNCLHPGDLYPFTRKHLFIIAESSNSNTFQHIPNLFGQCLVVLMSPEDVPLHFLDATNKCGSLFTMFLYSPLTAFSFVCNVTTIPMALWDSCEAQMDKYFLEAGRLLTRSQIDASYKQTYNDDFLRLIILRFIFCHTTLKLHKQFMGPRFYPKSHPRIPESEILEHFSLQKHVLDLASMLNVRDAFHDSASEVD